MRLAFLVLDFAPDLTRVGAFPSSRLKSEKTCIAGAVIGYNHVAVVVDDGAAPNEVGNTRSDLLPGVVLCGLQRLCISKRLKQLDRGWALQSRNCRSGIQVHSLQAGAAHLSQDDQWTNPVCKSLGHSQCATPVGLISKDFP